MKEFAALFARVADLERRVAGMVRSGPVAAVSPETGTVRLRLGGGDDKPFLSPPVPYAQIAGALKAHIPPSKGQQMTIICPGGDWRQGVALPMTWSDQNASPSDKGDENVITFGSVTIALKEDALSVTVGGVTFTISSDGTATTGGAITHNGTDIGDTHKHGGVIEGGADTGVPV